MNSKMLASVSNVNEAEIVLYAGVDIVDIKDPDKGALGAVEHTIAKEIVDRVAGQCLISATIGDLPMHAGRITDAISAMAETGVDIVKVGVFSDTLTTKVLSAISKQAKNNIDIVLVFFADRKPTLDNIAMLYDTGIMGVMLDTADKKKGSLRTLFSDEHLKYFIDHAKSAGLMVGLAGALRSDDVKALLQLKPDYLGFRGALCQDNQREQQINAESVQHVRSLIPSQIIDAISAVAGIQ